MRVGTKSNPRSDWLRNVALFSDCSERELERIAKLSTPVDVDAGRVLVEEGEIGREFFVVVDGWAMVTCKGSGLAMLGPGTFFGEMALLDGCRRIATVSAAGPMTVLAFSLGEFTSLMSAPPASVLRRMLTGLTSRLRDVDGRVVRSDLGGVQTEPVAAEVQSSPML